MMDPLYFPDEVAEQISSDAQKRWLTTSFRLVYDLTSERHELGWEDGPTVIEVRHGIPEITRARTDRFGHRYQEDYLTLERTLSLTAWALLRGPGLPPTDELPWDLQRARTDYYESMGEHPGVLQGRSLAAVTNLEDLSLVGGVDLLAQAETASALGHDLHPRIGLEVFDVWLRHGGWHASGQLLQTPRD